MITLYHTSPSPIAKITNNGTFGSFLCFAASPYFMTASQGAVVYSIDVADDEIIDARSLFYHEQAAKLKDIVDEVADRVGCDIAMARNLIDESDHLCNHCDMWDPEVDFDIQHASAKAARILGYRGVRLTDEQGGLWLIDMTGREAEFKKMTKV